MLDTYVLEAITGQNEKQLSRSTLKFFGKGESALEHELRDIHFDENLVVGYRAHFPEIHVTMSCWPKEGVDAPGLVQKARADVLGKLHRFLVAEEGETLAHRVGKALLARGAHTCVAESCTGGMIASMITDVSGSSGWFQESYVTYANEAKERLLGVERALLVEHGAVSLEVAVAMARGARAASGAQYAMATSGIAGPGGGTAQKPVGTVEIAVDTPEGTYVRSLRLRAYWGRARIRQASAHHALSLLLKVLEDRPGDDPKVVGPLVSVPREDV